jgi:hypothetical protein
MPLPGGKGMSEVLAFSFPESDACRQATPNRLR